jgi:hypothetical protein
MSLDALVPLVIVALFTVTAFVVSAAIGSLMVRLGAVDVEDVVDASPAQPDEAADVRSVARPIRSDERA